MHTCTRVRTQREKENVHARERERTNIGERIVEIKERNSIIAKGSPSKPSKKPQSSIIFAGNFLYNYNLSGGY